MKKLLFIFSFLTGTIGLYAQSILTVEQKTNDSKTYSLTKLQKITFENEVLVITDTSNVTEIFDLNNINKLYFGVYSSVADTKDDNTNFFFPNPAWDYIFISKESAEVNIFDLNGVSVFKLNNIKQGEAIDISTLPAGLYIIKINNSISKLRKL